MDDPRDDLPIAARLAIPACELLERFSRSGGPGGQNVNKTATKVELRWNPGASTVLADEDRRRLLSKLPLNKRGQVVVTSERTRDQGRNRRDARDKLAALVRRALARPRRRVATKPSRSAVERRIEEKKRRSTLKQERRRSD